MFLKLIAKMRHSHHTVCETGFINNDNCDSLGSISAVVTKKEERDFLMEEIFSDEENSSELESETDDEEYQCVVCKLDFVGEAKFEQHRKVSQHWG